MERTKITYYLDGQGWIVITRVDNADPGWFLPAEYLNGKPCYWGVYHKSCCQVILENGNQWTIGEGSRISPTLFPVLIKAMKQSGERLGACLERAKRTSEIEI